MNNRKEVFNKKELIYEKVHCAIFGNGIISLIDEDNEDEPCEVDFNGVLNWYSSSGYLSIITYRNPTLSFGHKEDIKFDYGSPLNKLDAKKAKPIIFAEETITINQQGRDALINVIKGEARPLVLKGWLEEKGIDTRIFWKNCKKKYNGHGQRRCLLAQIYGHYWIDSAFAWNCNLLGLCYEYMSELSADWMDDVDTAINNGIKIEFGFGGK